MTATDLDDLGPRADGGGNSQATEAPSLLVEAKLAMPSLRCGVIDRQRIRGALDAGRRVALTLVAAPAGDGKTTAVRAWSASLDAAVAWVTLDGGENDPVLLWSYVATAIDRVRPGPGRRALRRLGMAGGPVEPAVDELMNGAAGPESELVVVLDNLDTATSEERLSSIDYAVTHLPLNVHMVLLTCVDPALRLARLRAAGALIEVRGPDLAFTTAEAHQLLVVLGRLGLGRKEVDVLVKRTEGWPAALILAWLWLRTVGDPGPAVRLLGGDNRFVADYPSSEAPRALDEADRTLLHDAAVLGEFTADLCDVALVRKDSAARLAELERWNPFVSRRERGGWFRVHSLFAEYAIAHLRLARPRGAGNDPPTSSYGGGRVHRYSSTGELRQSITIPAEQTTGCAFGGPDLSWLYVTTATENWTDEHRRSQPTAGLLYRCTTDATGLPAAAYRPHPAWWHAQAEGAI